MNQLQLVVLALCLSGNAFAEIAYYSEKQALFGDTHVPTGFSLDAYLGGTRLTPADAYRFAWEESVSLD